MTSPPPHKDLIEAAKRAYTARRLSLGAPGFALPDWDEMLAHEKDAYISVASAVALFLLSVEPSEAVIEAGDATPFVDHGEPDFHTVYMAMNACRLSELGLDAKEGT
jgi:hypothetical protein